MPLSVSPVLGVLPCNLNSARSKSSCWFFSLFSFLLVRIEGCLFLKKNYWSIIVYSAVLTSAVQQSDSVIHIDIIFHIISKLPIHPPHSLPATTGCLLCLSYGICLCLSDLLHLVWHSLGPSMLLQMVLLQERGLLISIHVNCKPGFFFKHFFNVFFIRV